MTPRLQIAMADKMSLRANAGPMTYVARMASYVVIAPRSWPNARPPLGHRQFRIIRRWCLCAAEQAYKEIDIVTPYPSANRNQAIIRARRSRLKKSRENQGFPSSVRVAQSVSVNEPSARELNNLDQS